MKNTDALESIQEQNRDEIRRIFRGRCLLNPAHAGTDVHEIFTRSQRPKSWWELENMVLLCRNCHGKIHMDGAKTWRKELIRLRADWIEDYADKSDI